MLMSQELVENAAGRMVVTEINGRAAVPFQGVGKYRPTGNKAAPPIRSCNDYPADGNKMASGSHGATWGVRASWQEAHAWARGGPDNIAQSGA